MSVYSDIIDGLVIFDKYERGYQEFAAEHDVVYAGPSPDDVSKEDLERLEKFGWHPDESFDCFYKFV